MEGSAILTLLKANSQNNTYAQAVHSTYLMATGAQRQHFTVLASLGVSMGYGSVVTQGAVDLVPDVDVAGAATESGTESVRNYILTATDWSQLTFDRLQPLLPMNL